MSILRHGRSYLKRLLGVATQSDLALIESRIERLEERTRSYYRNRWDVLDNVADYLVGAGVPGDYVEFGVFKGMTFSYACRTIAPLLPDMQFIAVDSFEGLPEPAGVDAAGGYTSGFHEGQYACSEDQFRANLVKAEVDMARVRLVKGWYKDSLAPLAAEGLGIDRVALAWIDCDLYESTVPVLEFLTKRISIGSVLLFDDWRCFKNLPDFGEQRATREWLEANPQIRLHDFISFGFHGFSFTVGRC